MSTLIAYGTKHGCTERCANILAQRLTGKADIQNLNNSRSIDLSQYDSIIIGGSIYAGKILKEVSDFCTNNKEALINMKAGLFICGMQDDALQTEMDTSFPKELLDNAKAKGYFGGEFIFNKMNFMEKMIVKMIAKTNKDISKINVEAIESFARQMNTESQQAAGDK